MEENFSTAADADATTWARRSTACNSMDTCRLWICTWSSVGVRVRSGPLCRRGLVRCASVLTWREQLRRGGLHALNRTVELLVWSDTCTYSLQSTKKWCERRRPHSSLRIQYTGTHTYCPYFFTFRYSDRYSSLHGVCKVQRIVISCYNVTTVTCTCTFCICISHILFRPSRLLWMNEAGPRPSKSLKRPRKSCFLPLAPEECNRDGGSYQRRSHWNK